MMKHKGRSIELAEAETYSNRLKQLVAKAKGADAALSWLSDYGGHAVSDRQLTIDGISCSYAGSCHGHRDAMTYLEVAAGQMMSEILHRAEIIANEDLRKGLVR